MENFEYCVPTDFMFGRGAESQIGAKLAGAGIKRVLVHYGKGSVVRSGLLGRIIASLDAVGIEHAELGGVRPNPEVGLVRQAIETVRNRGIDGIVAVGGGSVIDSAKAVAAGARYEGDVWDFYSHEGRGYVDLPQGALPIACVLTIPAAGSEASAFTVLTDDASGLKSSMGSELLRPRFSFMNPELTMTLPPYQTACGCTDMFAHLLERYFSESPDVPVTDGIITSLMRTIRVEAPRVLESPHDYDARANIMWAAMLAHCGVAGCGRLEDWATHGLEHELSAHDSRIAHGAGLAVMFPAWMRYVYRTNPGRFARYGSEVFGLGTSGDEEADARRAIEATQRFFISLGMPAMLGELGVVEGDIEGFLPTLRVNKGEIFGSFKKISIEDAREIYRAAL
jgi:alcohol dehydrogenase YqhD (iron-dependent ADH family)